MRKAFWDYFWLSKLFLQAAGIFPIGGIPSMWKSTLTKFLPALPLVYGLHILIPEINYILFQTHTMDDLFDALTIVISVLGVQFRSIFVTVHRRKITRLFAICETLWDHTIPADYKVISIWAQRARLYSTAYFCAAQFSIAAFVLTGTVKQLSAPENSTIRYYPYHYPEDFSQSPQYEIKYMLQVIIGLVGHSFVVAADMTGTLLTLNMCGQLALIRSWLLDIFEEEFITTREHIDKSLEVTLTKCIRRHQIVMDVCTELDEVVRYINLAQIITGMYLLAISGSRLMESLESYRFLGPLLLAIAGLFFSCWPADNLSFAVSSHSELIIMVSNLCVSTEVAHAVYEVPWYRGSAREKIAVAIMLTRSQRVAKLTAGKFVVMSLETFSSIVSSGISFCMVLNSF